MGILAPLRVALCLALCHARLVTFSNTLPRRDSAGAVLNAHDGTTQRFPSAPGKFYYHAMGYPACNETGEVNGCNNCIFSRKNSMNVFSSPDLSSGSWTLEQPLYPGAAGFPECTYFRTQAVYNAATQLYVLWANSAGCAPHVCPNNTCAAYVTATSPSPAGPFTFQGMVEPTAAQLGNRSGFIGDFALFVDKDGAGYIILTHGTHGAGSRDMYIFSLTADYLGIGTATTGILPGQKLVEAPAFFRRGSVYYALLGGCTCMGLYGGGVGVLTAPHPLGPWSNITGSLDPGCPMWAQADCFAMGPGKVCNPVTQAQQNCEFWGREKGCVLYIFPVTLSPCSLTTSPPAPPLCTADVITVPLADGTLAYIWTGDKWQQSPDHMFDLQPQTWLPLSFDADGAIQPLQYVDSFQLDIAA